VERTAPAGRATPINEPLLLVANSLEPPGAMLTGEEAREIFDLGTAVGVIKRLRGRSGVKASGFGCVACVPGMGGLAEDAFVGDGFEGS
jgi:hypothetical protein